MRLQFTFLCFLCALAMDLAPGARAQTMEPLSYTNSPIGLNFLIAGYGYQTGNVLVDPSLPVKNVKATVDNAFLAYSRVLDFWGQSGSLALVMPYAWLSASGQVFEQQRSVDRTGLSDLTLKLSVNLHGAPALSLKDFANYHQDWIIGALTPVERFEPIAQSSGLDSDDGVGLGVKGRAPAQGLDRNHGLFDFAGPAGERAHNDKSQEATGAFGIGKGCTGQDAIELCTNALRVHDPELHRTEKRRRHRARRASCPWPGPSRRE